ncbi:MAG: DUF975 family protein [Ruminococcus sp.]|nr:DUF975 family protein [Ruminococcus sp.]
MSAEKLIKAQAKEKLKHGGWAKALFALAILVIVYMLVECVALLGSYTIDVIEPNKTVEFIIEVAGGSLAMIVALLLSPVVLGFFRMFYSGDKEYSMDDVLYYFSSAKHYTKAIKFVLSFILRMFLPTLLYSIPPIAWYLANYFFNDNRQMELWSNAIFVLLIIFAILFTLRHSIRYFVSILLLCENEFESTSYYFKTSKQIMKRHEKDVVKLFWSFIGWILLSITGLPALYTIPYFTQALCLSGKWLVELSRNGQNL